jgi:hypothetical protein
MNTRENCYILGNFYYKDLYLGLPYSCELFHFIQSTPT